MLGNFGVFSVLRAWKLTGFLTTCLSATSFKIWTFSAFLYIYETTRTNFLKSLPIIFLLYIIMSETFIKIDYCNTLKFQDKTILRTGQKSALQQSLFWRYANFSKLMRTIHISMTSKFQCEYCQCFTIKRCDKFKLKCTSHGDMYSMHSFGKNSLTSKQWML